MQEFGEKSEDLTDVFNSCWVFGRENVAFTNQNGEDTNQIGRFEVLDVILHRHFMDKCEDGLRSSCWHLRSWLA